MKDIKYSRSLWRAIVFAGIALFSVEAAFASGSVRDSEWYGAYDSGSFVDQGYVVKVKEPYDTTTTYYWCCKNVSSDGFEITGFDTDPEWLGTFVPGVYRGTWNGYPGNTNLFVNKNYLHSGDFPAVSGRTLVKLGHFAFFRCASSSIYIPKTVKEIGSNVFDGCTNLLGLTIPDGLEKIGDEAFSGCSSMGDINIPDSVVSIGKDAFAGCVKLLSSDMTVIDKCLVAVNRVEGTVNVPKGVRLISDEAFIHCDGMTDLVIPDSVERIGTYAFGWCYGLTDVVVPTKVVDLGIEAFRGCSNVKKVTMPSDLVKSTKSQRLDYWFGDSPYGSPNYTSPIEEVVLTPGAQYLSNSLFKNCRTLKKVALPTGVLSLDMWIFDGCVSLEAINIPNTVQKIFHSMYSGSALWNNSPNGPIVIDRCLVGFKGVAATELRLPDNLRLIAGYMDGLENVKTLILPEDVEALSEGAFYYLKNLERIDFEGPPPKNLAKAEIANTVLVRYNAKYAEEWRTVIKDCGILSAVEYTLCAPDGGPYKETVGSVEYTFFVSNGKATIGTGSSSPAVSTSTSGALVIPSTLGGCPMTAIGDYAFRECNKITAVTIPASVTTITYRSFYAAEGILNFTIAAANPNYLTNDGVIYTKDLKTLVSCPGGKQSVVVPSGVETIGEGAFKYCSYLSSVALPEGLKVISDGSFAYCPRLAELVIPSGVTAIGAGAFSGDNNLASVTIPSSVTSVGSDAFCGCSVLKTVYVEKGDTARIRSLMTGKGVDVNKLAFVEPVVYSSITYTNLNGATHTNPATYEEGSSVAFTAPSSISGYTFIGWEPAAITAETTGNVVVTAKWVEFPRTDGGPYLESVSGVSYRFVVVKGEAVITAIECQDSSVGEIVVPSTLGGRPVSRVGVLIQMSPSITSLILPEGMTTIASEAFGLCSSLVSIKIPKSMISLDVASSFSCCLSLERIEVDEENPVYKSIDGVLYDKEVLTLLRCPGAKRNVIIPAGVKAVGESACTGCRFLTSVTMPECVTDIGRSAFSACELLSSVTILGEVTSIKEYTFLACPSLVSISLPSSVKTISRNAFDRSVSFEEVYGWSKLVPVTDKLRTVKISESETTIVSCAFEHCSSLTSVTIPDSVTTIGSSAFYGCSSLTSVTIPSSVTTIGSSAFYATPFYDNQPDGFVIFGTLLYEYKGACPSKVTIPSSVTTIGSHAFMNCSSLTSVTIPSSVTTLGEGAFKYCGNLSSVALPEGLKVISDWSFAYCPRLAELVIPSGVTTIGAGAFSGDNDLTSVTIPSSVTSVGNEAFWGCSVLKTVHVEKGDTARIRSLMTGKGVDVDKINFVEPVVYSSITYTNLNGATHTNPATYEEGSSVAFTAPSSISGYTFIGWEPAAIAAETTGNVVVTAKWQANTYTISYNANGGSGSMANTDATYDQNATIATCGFTRTGFEFVGWSLEKTARPESAPYRVGDVVRNLASNQGAVVELFAVWKNVEPTNCAAPIVTPGNGEYFINGLATVSISCETKDAIIYYSTSGSTPKKTEAYRYKGPFMISGTTTVKAVAVYTRTDGQTLTSDYVTVVITKKTATLADAVGAPDLTFKTGGDAAWTIVTDVEADDGICVQSGKIGDDQTTWIETTLTGAGLFTFKWKSECENDPDGATWDRLVCTIDGVEHSRIDGTIAWTQVSLSLNQGTHTIRWMYVKDESESEGRDCAWLDGVVWTPSSTCPPEIESADESVKAAFDAWVSQYGVTDPSAANVNAFVLGLAPTATEEAIQAKVEEELANLDLGKLVEGNISAAVAEIQAKYPNAKVDLALVEDLNTSAHLYKLVIKLK